MDFVSKTKAPAIEGWWNMHIQLLQNIKTKKQAGGKSMPAHFETCYNLLFGPDAVEL